MVRVNLNYYEILAVRHDASKEEIVRSYRKLLLLFYPDKNANKVEAEEKTKLFNLAYEVLADPNKREAYDQQLLGQDLLKDCFDYSANFCRSSGNSSSRLFFQTSVWHQPITKALAMVIVVTGLYGLLLFRSQHLYRDAAVSVLIFCGVILFEYFRYMHYGFGNPEQRRGFGF